MNNSRFFIAEWLVDPQLKRISRGDEVKTLEPQLMAVLVYLASRQNSVVTKEELMAEIWKGVIVGENVLTRAISSLRKSLGDSRGNPQYIETISKTGYRLIADVSYTESRKSGDTHVEIKVKKRPLLIAAAVIVLILMGAFAMRQIFLPLESNVVYHPMALASNSVPEYYPSISPDGQFVAYAARSEEDNNWDVYAKRIGTETLIRLTNHPSVEMRAVWSPDGNEVYFMRYDQGGHIYKVPMTGGKETRVLSAGSFSSGNFDISPNGDEIAFNSREAYNKPLRVELTSLADESKKLLTLPPEGFNGDIHPTYSPDGTQLAFIRERNPVSMYLYVLDIETGVERQVTTAHQSINGFDWSADGNSLIYGSDKTGIYKLWQVDLNSGSNSLLPATDYQMVMPRVAANERMVYAKLQDDVNIWNYSLDREESKSWRSTAELDINPSHSPDGSRIAFTTNRNGSFQLWTSNVDGTDAIAITQFEGQYVNTPHWSPDGEEIVFQGYLNGQADIFKVNSLGGIAENLTNTNYDEHTPIFSIDGHSVFYSSDRSGDWQIWQIDADGRNPVKVTSEGGYAPQPTHEKELLFVRKDRPGIWRIDLDNKEVGLAIAEFDSKNYGAFTVAPEGIYYLNSRERSLCFKMTGSDEVRSLIPIKRIPRMGISISYSKQQNSVLYAQVDHIDADIMMLVEQ